MTSQNDKKYVLNIYAAFGAALILSVIPTLFAAILSLILGTGVLVAAYMLRRTSEDGGLIANHMTFLIRTIWIGSLFALITITLGSVYLLMNVDNAPLEPCIAGLLNNVEHLQNMAGLKSMFGECYGPYWFLNSRTFITSGVIIALPVMLYFLVRFGRGLSRALKGYRVANPRSWF